MNRVALRNAIEVLGDRSKIKSHNASPIAVANLNPWPLNPQAYTTFGISGCLSTMKWPSGEFVYRHDSRESISPAASGIKRDRTGRSCGTSLMAGEGWISSGFTTRPKS